MKQHTCKGLEEVNEHLGFRGEAYIENGDEWELITSRNENTVRLPITNCPYCGVNLVEEHGA